MISLAFEEICCGGQLIAWAYLASQRHAHESQILCGIPDILQLKMQHQNSVAVYHIFSWDLCHGTL